MTEKELLGPYKLVLGLEIHLQPTTEQKMFCGCNADIWGAEPNTHTCPVCLGLPGALPVPNKDAVKKIHLLGMAFGCHLNKDAKFDRKHYFYPDLPKGYQISQYKQPFCEGGEVKLNSGNIAYLERIHLEEDVAKSFHHKDKTLIDFNKSGMPLIEMVTKPCFRNTADAVDYCHKVQQMVRFINIGEVDMEKGQMRLEANISLRTKDMEERDELPKYKVEVKNINSFKFMEKAVRAEIVRQRDLLEKGQTPAQENRGYNEKTGKTVLQRSKEDAHDYRYFPEPDIPPMEFTQEYFEDLKVALPELPQQIKNRFKNDYGLSENAAKSLVDVFGQGMVQKFEGLVNLGLDPKETANILINNKESHGWGFEDFKKSIQSKNDTIESSDVLGEIAQRIINVNEKAVLDYKNGKEESIKYLLGMMMKESHGKISPNKALEVLQAKLK